MTDRDALLAHLEELLDASAFEDYGPNGLQVPGTREIQSIVSGVSAGLELFERAADARSAARALPPRPLLGRLGRGAG